METGKYKKSMMTQAKLPPCNPGMRVVEIVPDFKFKNLNDPKGKNEVRHGQEDIKQIGKLQQIIKNGKYEPQFYVSPIVEIKGDFNRADLISGFHRYAAHIGCGKETMYVTVVEFFAAEGKSAEYWRLMWKLVENDKEEKIETPRTKADIVKTLVQMIADEIMTSSEKDIDSALKDAHLTPTKISEYKSEIFKELGKSHKVVTTIDTKEHKRLVEGKSGITVTYSEPSNPDYESRALRAWQESKIKGKNKPLVTRINNAGNEKIDKVREVKDDSLKSLLLEQWEFWKPFFESGKSPYDEDFEFPEHIYCGQKYGESDYVNLRGEDV